MKCIIIIFLLSATHVLSLNEDVSFDEWQTINNVKFPNVVEKKYRQEIFYKIKAEIKAHNADPTNTYKKGLNKFSHMSSEEFIAYYCGAVIPEKLKESAENTSVVPDHPIVAAPLSLDLRYLMQPVQDQRSCGSCWSFSTMASLGN